MEALDELYCWCKGVIECVISVLSDVCRDEKSHVMHESSDGSVECH